jgi:hypothetical protein
VFPEGAESEVSGVCQYPPGGFFHLEGDPMNTQDFKRKLTAIMSADVAGYSRLMGDNESETVKTLEAYKQVMQKEEGKTGWLDKPPVLLPEKPSIAVLPFVNMSDDPEQQMPMHGTPMLRFLVGSLQRRSFSLKKPCD